MITCWRCKRTGKSSGFRYSLRGVYVCANGQACMKRYEKQWEEKNA